jgi:hypothetical protein
MKIGIVGSGKMGSALGRLWAKAGHEVVFSDILDVGKLQELAASAGPNARAGTIAEAAAWGEVILLGVHWSAHREAIDACGNLAGKILIDVINPVAPDFSDLEFGFTTSASEEIAKRAAGAKVVKAFNTIPSPVFALEGCRIAGQKVSVFHCGDDPDAKHKVAQLISDAGFEPVDSGPLTSARYLEAAGMLLIRIVVTLKASPELALTLVRNP